MFVNPLSMNPKEFYKNVLNQSKIKNPSAKLKISILKKSKDQIRRFC